MKIDCVKNTILKRCKLHKHTTHTKIILASFLFLVVFLFATWFVSDPADGIFFCFFSFTICFVLLWLLSLLLKFFFFISFAVGVNFFCLVFVVTAMLCCCWTHLLRFFPVCYVRLIIFDSRQMQKKPRHIHTHSEATSA